MVPRLLQAETEAGASQAWEGQAGEDSTQIGWEDGSLLHDSLDSSQWVFRALSLPQLLGSSGGTQEGGSRRGFSGSLAEMSAFVS